jgi:hypothetical protein
MKTLKIAGLFVGGLLVGTIVASWYWWHIMALQMSSKSVDVAFRASEEAEWVAQLRLNETSKVVEQLERVMSIGVVTLAEWEETKMLDDKSRIARDKWLVPVKVYYQSYPVRGAEAERVNSLLATVPGREVSSTCKSGICRLDDLRLARSQSITNSP